MEIFFFLQVTKKYGGAAAAAEEGERLFYQDYSRLGCVIITITQQLQSSSPMPSSSTTSIE